MHNDELAGALDRLDVPGEDGARVDELGPRVMSRFRYERGGCIREQRERRLAVGTWACPT
jgi:hypothetical protein